MTAWVAFIESNTTGTGRLFCAAARAEGHRPVLLCADPGRYPYLTDDAIATAVVDTQDHAAVVACCRALAHDGGLAGVTSTSEYFIACAARVAAELGLPGPPAAAIERCRDKGEQRRALARAGVGVPRHAVAASIDEVRAAIAAIGLPVVVKPVAGSGSVGVRACRTADEAAAHAAGLLAIRANERGQAPPGRVLVEELVVGPEYSVETFGREVIGVTAKHLGEPPFFVETGHDFPAPDHTGAVAAVKAEASRALEALGLGWGPAHTEIRHAAAGPRIIEVNPRLAGGFIPELIRHASGLDVIRQAVRNAIGRPVELGAACRRHASIRFVLADRAGTLVSVAGADAARAIPGVVDVRTYIPDGQRVEPRGDFRDRIGHVIACGDAGAVAAEAAATARALLRPSIDSGSR